MTEANPLPRRASILTKVLLQEDLNFLLTNRIPRRWASLAMAWFSKIESPTLTKLSVAVWRVFAGDLALHEAAHTDFRSLHEVFIRQLRRGARPIDDRPDVIVSPCDAIVGACGRVRGTEVVQAKGYTYALEELLGDRGRVETHTDGWFVTLRLKSSFYHRFHAPHGGRVRGVTYFSGDTWNVNPIALKRVEKLFCKNERAVIDMDLEGSSAVLTLVPVAAILVAGIKLHCVDEVFNLRYRGANRLECDTVYAKGDEMGYFQSGSTIIVFGSGPLQLAEGVTEGAPIRMGEPLFSILSDETSPEEST